MKKQSDQIIIYDDACPMCTAYTGAFIHLGWLTRRIAFSEIPKEILQRIDVDRGRHEIPLYNTRNGETIYGLDALFFIIGNHFPWLKPFFRNRIFRFFWKQLYWLITYNRRIIAGSAAPGSGMDCAPDRHLGYRWGYILLMATVTLWLVWQSTFRGNADIPLVWGLRSMLGLSLTIGLLFKSDRLSWLGHWVTVSFMLAVGWSLLPISPIPVAGLLLLGGYFFWKRWILY